MHARDTDGPHTRAACYRECNKTLADGGFIAATAPEESQTISDVAKEVKPSEPIPPTIEIPPNQAELAEKALAETSAPESAVTEEKKTISDVAKATEPEATQTPSEEAAPEQAVTPEAEQTPENADTQQLDATGEEVAHQEEAAAAQAETPAPEKHEDVAQTPSEEAAPEQAVTPEAEQTPENADTQQLDATGEEVAHQEDAAAAQAVTPEAEQAPGTTSSVSNVEASDVAFWSGILLAYLLMSFSYMRIGNKLGRRESWQFFVPIYNLYILLWAVHLPKWHIIFLLIPVVNIVYFAFLAGRIAVWMGRSFTVYFLLTFLFALSILILAFDPTVQED